MYIKIFTKESVVRRDLGNRVSLVDGAHMKRPLVGDVITKWLACWNLHQATIQCWLGSLCCDYCPWLKCIKKEVPWLLFSKRLTSTLHLSTEVSYDLYSYVHCVKVVV